LTVEEPKRNISQDRKSQAKANILEDPMYLNSPNMMGRYTQNDNFGYE